MIRQAFVLRFVTPSRYTPPYFTQPYDTPSTMKKGLKRKSSSSAILVANASTQLIGISPR